MPPKQSKSAKTPSNTLKTPSKSTTGTHLQSIDTYTLPQLNTLIAEYNIDLTQHTVPTDRNAKKQYLYNLINDKLNDIEHDIQQWSLGWNERTTTKPSPRSPKHNTPAKRKSKSSKNSDSDNESTISTNSKSKRRSTKKQDTTKSKDTARAQETDTTNYIDPELLASNNDNDTMSIDTDSDTERYVESQPRKSLRPNEFQSGTTKHTTHTPPPPTITYHTQHTQRGTSSPATVTVPTLSSRYTQPATQPTHIRTKSRLADELNNDDEYFESLIHERMKSTFEKLKQQRTDNTIDLTQPDISKLSLNQRKTSFGDIKKPNVVPSPEPEHTTTTRTKSQHKSTKPSNLLMYLIPSLLLSLLGLTGLLLHNNPTLYAYQPFTLLEPYFHPFCASNILEENTYPIVGKKQCIPCPKHAVCTHGHIQCDNLYQRSGNICVESKKLHNKVGYYSDIAVELLQRYKGNVECGNIINDDSTTGVYETELRNMLIDTDNDILNNDIIYHKTLTNLQQRNDVFYSDGYYEAIKPIYPFTCRVRKYVLHHILELSAVTSILSFISYIIFKIRQYFRRRQTRKVVLSQVYDILQSTDAPLAIDHVKRDLEITDNVVWQYVINNIANDTRVQKSQNKFGQVKRDSWQWEYTRKTPRKSIPPNTIYDTDNDVVMQPTYSNITYTGDALGIQPPGIANQFSDNIIETQQQQNKKSCVIC